MAAAIVYGTRLADILYGVATRDASLAYDDIVYGLGGADQIYGSIGADWFWAQAGDASNVHFEGGAANDVLVSFDGADYLQGDDGADILIAGAGDDTLYGGAGDDQLWGGTGQDKLIGNDGSDILVGGDGADVIYGWGFGAASFASAYDRDTIDGGAGNDVVYADGKADVFGGDGNDIINVSNEANVDAGAGDDWIIDNHALYGNYAGGAGADTYVVTYPNGPVVRTIFDVDGPSVILGGQPHEFRSPLTITTGDANDWIQGGAYVVAGGGDDVILPGYAAFVFDQSGNDAIVETEGVTAYHMGAGVDTYDLRDAVSETVVQRQRGSRDVDLGYSNLDTHDHASQLIYDDAAGVAAGNLDIVRDFNAHGVDNVHITDVYNEVGRYQRTDGPTIRDSVYYSSGLGMDVTWANDANGDLLMMNSAGIFAKFIGVAAADMNLAFHYF